MARRHEEKRVRLDINFDAMMKSEELRMGFWDNLLHQGRLYSLISLLESTLHLPGDVIECGVYRGASLFKICRRVSDLSPAKVVYACDSFEGFPPEQVGRWDRTLFRPLRKLRNKFTHSWDMPERIEVFSRLFDVSVQTIKGRFSETLPSCGKREYCFIHLDADLYLSIKDCMQALFPCLVPGGIMVLDDYDSVKWPGVKRAVDEYLLGTATTLKKCEVRNIPCYYLQKPLE